MDSLTSFKELASCGICFELFNEDNRCPRLLPCGHTYCHSCLEKILLQNSSCPMCKADIKSPKADVIPVNYVARGLICIVNQNNNPSDTPDSNKLESEGFCNEHSNDKQIRCMDCKSWICGTCSVLKHKHCRTLPAREAYKELKGQISGKVEKELEARKSTIEKVEKSLKCLEEERKNYEIKIKECNMKISKLNSIKAESSEGSLYLQQVQMGVKTLKNESEISKVLNKLDDLSIQGKNWLPQLENLKLHSACPIKIKDLRDLSKKRRDVYVVDIENEPLYGKVTLVGEQIRISSFNSMKPEGLLIPFKEFLQSFSGSTDLPNMVYMKVRDNASDVYKEFDMVMETKGTSPIVKNFVLLCSGLKRHTLKDFEIIQEDYSNDHPFLELNSLISPKEEGFFFDRCVSSFGQAGSIFGGIKRGHWRFVILLSRDYCDHSPIGHVISGLQAIKQYNPYYTDLIIADCGLVIQMNQEPSGGAKLNYKGKYKRSEGPNGRTSRALPGRFREK